MLLVDTNVIIDLFGDDPEWYRWSSRQLSYQSSVEQLVINPVVYAELSSGFSSRQHLEKCLEAMGLRFIEIAREALYIAGVAHRHYRSHGGQHKAILADFLIGAHAVVLGCGILTRDPRRYRTYFPRVPLVTP